MLEEVNTPVRPSKKMEKSSLRVGSTTTRTELPVLDFALTQLAKAAPKRTNLFKENMETDDGMTKFHVA